MSKHPQRLKLTRLSGISLVRFETLWLEQDHLIVCSGYGVLLPFIEEYRRFFFRDIQGIQIAINQRQHAVTVILAVLTLLALGSFLLSALAGKSWWGLAAFFGLVTAGLLCALAAHVYKGSTCSVVMKTAVQTVHLKSVTRLNEAGQLLARLDPLIKTAQSDLPDLLPERPVSGSSPAAPFAATAVSSRTVTAPPALSAQRMDYFWHWLSGGLMAVWSLLALTDYYIQQVWVSLLGIPVVFALLLTPIIALIRQRQGKSSGAFAVISWLGVALSMLILISGYAALINIQIKHPEMAGDQWKMLKYYAELAPGSDSLMTVMTALEVILSSSLGLVYLGFTLKEKIRQERTPLSPLP